MAKKGSQLCTVYYYYIYESNKNIDFVNSVYGEMQPNALDFSPCHVFCVLPELTVSRVMFNNTFYSTQLSPLHPHQQAIKTTACPDPLTRRHKQFWNKFILTRAASCAQYRCGSYNRCVLARSWHHNCPWNTGPWLADNQSRDLSHGATNESSETKFRMKLFMTVCKDKILQFGNIACCTTLFCRVKDRVELVFYISIGLAAATCVLYAVVINFVGKLMFPYNVLIIYLENGPV